MHHLLVAAGDTDLQESGLDLWTSIHSFSPRLGFHAPCTAFLTQVCRMRCTVFPHPVCRMPCTNLLQPVLPSFSLSLFPLHATPPFPYRIRKCCGELCTAHNIAGREYAVPWGTCTSGNTIQPAHHGGCDGATAHKANAVDEAAGCKPVRALRPPAQTLVKVAAEHC